MRAGFFLCASALAVAITGYYFGTYDQDIYIPFLRAFANPSLYPGDPLLALREVKYSFFWFAFLPFYRLGILEPAVFAVHIVTVFATFWTMWELSQTLFRNALTNLLVSVALIFPHVGYPGFPFFEFCTLNRTFVLPIIFGALILYLRRHIVPAFLLLGLTYNLHVYSVNYVMAMLLLDCVIRAREIGWRKIGFGLLLFIAGAWPVLFWRWQHPIDFAIRPELFSLVAQGSLASLYYVLALNPLILLNALNGVGTLVLFLIGRRAGPDLAHNRTITHFVCAIAIVLGVNIITVYWLSVTFILQLQISRIGTFLLYFGYLYFANLLATQYQSGKLKGLDFGIIAATFASFVSPALPALVWALRRWFTQGAARRLAVAGAIVAIHLLVIVAAVWAGVWPAGIHVYGPRTPWVEAQVWARDHTPLDTLFITPPHLDSYYVPDWRVFSERSSFVTNAELMEGLFIPELAESWQTRFEQVAPGAIERFDGFTPDNLRFTSEAFYSLSCRQYADVAGRNHAGYLVLEKPHACDFPVIFENEGFSIYDLRSLIGE